MRFRVRPLTVADTDDALKLYTELTVGPAPTASGPIHAVLSHPGSTIYGAEIDSRIRAMATLHLLPNVTWNARPYGLIENVVTAVEYQRRGLGKAVLETALEAAWAADAHKVMLMTGKKRGARGFYESVGFSTEDKDAMVIRRS